MKDKLIEAAQLQEKLDKFTDLLYPALKKYAVSEYYGDYIENVEINRNETVSFYGVQYGRMGGSDDREYFILPFSYFDDPDTYIENKKRQDTKNCLEQQHKEAQERLVSAKAEFERAKERLSHAERLKVDKLEVE